MTTKKQLITRLAQTHHEARLYHRAGTVVRRIAKHRQRAIQLGCSAYPLMQPRHCFYIVRKDIDARIKNCNYRVHLAGKVRHQEFNFHFFILPSEELYSPGKNRGSPIRQVISRHRSDDDLF